MSGKTDTNIEELEVLLYEGTRATLGWMNQEEMERRIAQGGRWGEIFGGLKRLREKYERLIREKSGSPVTLTAAGTNKYTGTRPSPDGTAQLPVTVTVEAERIVIETSGGGLSSKDVFTPRGFEPGTLK